MRSIIASEWIKLRTVRMNWVLGIIAVAFPLIVTVLTAALVNERDLDTEQIVDVTIGTSIVTALLLGVIGAVSIAGEFGFGTIRPTFAATPRRWRVIAGKGIVIVAFSAVAQFLVIAVTYLVASTIAEGRDRPVSLDELPWATAAMAGLVVFAAIMGLLGFALGLLVRNTPAAVSVLILWPLLVENLVAGLLIVAGVDDAAKYMPYAAGFALASPDSGGDDSGLLGRVPGGLYFGSVVLVLLVIGGLLTNRRDA